MQINFFQLDILENMKHRAGSSQMEPGYGLTQQDRQITGVGVSLVGCLRCKIKLKHLRDIFFHGGGGSFLDLHAGMGSVLTYGHPVRDGGWKNLKENRS